MKLLFTFIASIFLLQTAAAQSKLYVNRDMEGPVKKKNAEAWIGLEKENEKSYAHVYKLIGKKKISWGKIECSKGVAKENWNGQGFWYYAGSKRLFSKGKYLKGMKDGEWLFYFESGQTQSKGNYLSNKTVGIWRNYHENGKQSSILHYNLSGEKHGLQRFYPNDNDTTARNYKYYENGKANGLSIYYNADNITTNTYVYLKDSLNGNSYSYYPNGAIQWNKIYTDNGRTDSSIYYFNNGQIASKEYFESKNNFSHYVWFDTAGNKIKEGTQQYDTEPGGDAFQKEVSRIGAFVQDNFEYPSKAIENGISCYLKILMSVDTNGNITIEKIENFNLESADYGFEKEARRVINQYGKTIPMPNHNLPEKVKLSLPIRMYVN